MIDRRIWSGDQTDDALDTDRRHFYKVEKWSWLYADINL